MLIWAWAWVGRPWLASQLNDWWVAAQQLSRTAQLSWDPCGFQCTQQKRLLDAWPSRPWAPLPFSPALPHLPARVHVLYYHRLARPCPALPAFVESCCWSNCKGQRQKERGFFERSAAEYAGRVAWSVERGRCCGCWRSQWLHDGRSGPGRPASLISVPVAITDYTIISSPDTWHINRTFWLGGPEHLYTDIY